MNDTKSLNDYIISLIITVKSLNLEIIYFNSPKNFRMTYLMILQKL